MLALRLIFMGATGAAANVMLGASRERAVALTVAGEAALNVAATLALVPAFGVLGAAWGATAPTMAIALVAWPWMLRRRFGIRRRVYLAAAWMRPAVAALPFAGATLLVERTWPAMSLPVFVLTALLLPLALVGVWFAGLSRAERQRCLDAVLAWRTTGAGARST